MEPMCLDGEIQENFFLWKKSKFWLMCLDGEISPLWRKCGPVYYLYNNIMITCKLLFAGCFASLGTRAGLGSAPLEQERAKCFGLVGG